MKTNTKRSRGHLNEAADIIKKIHSGSLKRNDFQKSIEVHFRSKNGFAAKRDQWTHLIHRYPAKMFHRIPSEILNSINLRKNSITLDPFCGSGTVLLEGAIRGHKTIGIDINPLAQLISKVKTTPLDPKKLLRKAKNILKGAKNEKIKFEENELLNYWFKKEISKSLFKIRQKIFRIRDEEYRNFFLVVFSSIIREVSLADPAIPPPVKLNSRRASKTNDRYRKALKRSQRMNSKQVFDQFENAIYKNIERNKQIFFLKNFVSPKVLCPPSEAKLTGLPSRSVDLILTSPPYCGAQKYVRSLKLEMFWIGLSSEFTIEIDKRTLGTERISINKKSKISKTPFKKINILLDEVYDKNPARGIMLAQYINYLDQFAEEISRLLRKGGNAFVTFGTSRIGGIEVDMANLFSIIAKKKDLKLITTLVDKIPSHGLMTKRNSTSGIINDEKLVWLKA